MEFKVAKNTAKVRFCNTILLFDSLAIKQLLHQQLISAINCLEKQLNVTLDKVSETLELTLLDNSRQSLECEFLVKYRSSIALKIAGKQQEDAIDIASRLAAFIPTIVINPTPGETFLDVNVQVTSPGWIDFQLNDKSLGIWLQTLTQRSAQLSEKLSAFPKNYSEAEVFPVQCAHGRCCSLLRLAQRQELIHLNDDSTWQIIAPNPLPWLDANGQLRLVHPAERRLIYQIARTVDELICPTCPDCVKVAKALSEAMLEFDRHCRIWGEVKIETPQLAQARLGLVAIARSLMRSLLQNRMGASAPEEL
jgi:arginyl-tRNA synthetase